MKNLIEILKTETASLKEQYIQKTQEWASNYYNLLVERNNWDEKKWCEFFGLTPELKNAHIQNRSYYGFPSGFYNTSNARKFDTLKAEIRKMSCTSLSEYLAKEEKFAIAHYELSIEKLAARIEKKGLNIDSLTVTTSHIGVNINTTLTDGSKTVKAFTIIASGEIQKPHYRYLVK